MDKGKPMQCDPLTRDIKYVRETLRNGINAYLARDNKKALMYLSQASISALGIGAMPERNDAQYYIGMCCYMIEEDDLARQILGEALIQYERYSPTSRETEIKKNIEFTLSNIPPF